MNRRHVNMVIYIYTYIYIPNLHELPWNQPPKSQYYGAAMPSPYIIIAYYIGMNSCYNFQTYPILPNSMVQILIVDTYTDTG